MRGLKSGLLEEVQTVVLSRQSLDASLPADLILFDGEGYAHAAAGYGIQDDELTVVVVRPDTYVGAIVQSPSDMMAYFTRVFGASLLDS